LLLWPPSTKRRSPAAATAIALPGPQCAPPRRRLLSLGKLLPSLRMPTTRQHGANNQPKLLAVQHPNYSPSLGRRQHVCLLLRQTPTLTTQRQYGCCRGRRRRQGHDPHDTTTRWSSAAAANDRSSKPQSTSVTRPTAWPMDANDTTTPCKQSTLGTPTRCLLAAVANINDTTGPLYYK
jgi:hypothetical protein